MNKPATPDHDDNPRPENEWPEDWQEKRGQWFSMSYAYDVPHYADFRLYARDQEEAEAIAQRLLDSGTIPELLDDETDPCFENSDRARVFIHEVRECENLRSLPEYASDKKENAYAVARAIRKAVHEVRDATEPEPLPESAPEITEPKNDERTYIERLCRFAKRTLATLENHLEWNSDTTDEIGLAAVDLQLAHNDAQSLFRITPKTRATPAKYRLTFQPLSQFADSPEPFHVDEATRDLAINAMLRECLLRFDCAPTDFFALCQEMTEGENATRYEDFGDPENSYSLTLEELTAEQSASSKD